jgi:hypothetical protein
MFLSWFGNAVFKRISGIGITYQTNYLNKKSQTKISRNAPKPGERLPRFTFVINGINSDIRENVSCTAFHLIIFLKSGRADKLLRTAAKYRQVLTTRVIPFNSETKVLFLKFGIRSNGWYLVRPDLHIACRSDNTGTKDLNNYFRKILITKKNG